MRLFVLSIIDSIALCWPHKLLSISLYILKIEQLAIQKKRKTEYTIIGRVLCFHKNSFFLYGEFKFDLAIKKTIFLKLFSDQYFNFWVSCKILFFPFIPWRSKRLTQSINQQRKTTSKHITPSFSKTFWFMGSR